MIDALGSTHRIVSEAGVIVTEGKQAFATFGDRANAENRSTLSESQLANFNAVLPRGYTGWRSQFAFLPLVFAQRV